MSRFFVSLAALGALAIGSAPPVFAQMGASSAAGVAVDAKGVLSHRTFEDPGARLTRQKIAAAKAALNQKVARQSPLRKVSLNRLEAAIDAEIAQGREPTADMKCLAGLTRIKYVFFYPDSGDIVLAGPAEGWFEDLSGRVRGIESGLPTCLLDHLVVALRAFAPGGDGPNVVGCSIDPTAEGLTRMQEFLRKVRPRSTADGPAIAGGLRDALGLQNVRVMGVDPDTHFAHIMIEADYRMKLIGIALERPPVPIKSYVERASAAQISANAMQRWYFTPDYQCLRVSDDRLAMEMVGDGVKLIGEDELVGAGGERKKNARANLASKAFVEDFTKRYPELAAKSPVFAQLRVLIDMLVAAAQIQQEDYYGKAKWKAATLMDEKKLPVRTLNAAKQAQTAANSLVKGGRLLTPVGGGVEIQPRQALASGNLLRDEGGKLGGKRNELTLKDLAAGQWWWD
ncbi:MAG: DUF1598 domain-containing protein [Gemmataceae bacterium]|nr:DUF1598 domain-containing protein [Gemmataceae bacterium]